MVLEFSGQRRVQSSAYFNRRFKISNGFRSAANIKNSVGPIPEPWTMDLLKEASEDNLNSKRVA
jgi:hypothetical protein